MKKLGLYLFVIGISWFAYRQLQSSTACSANAETAQAECVNPIQFYEDPARIPLRTFVLDELGDLDGKTVLDIGAGTGFFAFEMAETAKRVLTTELDPSFLKYMTEKKTKLNVNNFEVLPADESHSELENLHVDYALMVYVFHYLDNPKLYFKKLRKTLNPDGKIFIANAQIAPTIIKDYLEMTGFVNISESHFSYTQAGCAEDVQVQMISAQLPTS